MKINGLNLPITFVQDIQVKRLHRERGSCELLECQNAYGEPLETELGEIYEDVASIEKATGELEQDFCDIGEDAVGGITDMFADAPGRIPYIFDFRRIVCFATAGDGAPFCFDYRDSEQEPHVIWWADAYWQRVAPDYDTFIRLFDIPTVA